MLSHHFFPSDNSYIELIAIFGAFAIGFLSRPLSALIFGYYGDKIGRENALLYSIIIITSATVAIGLLPSYETIGIMSPITLIVLRILQGISGGGEFTGSLVLITESSPVDRRGYYGSFLYSSAQFGLLLGSLATAIIFHLFSTHTVEPTFILHSSPQVRNNFFDMSILIISI